MVMAIEQVINMKELTIEELCGRQKRKVIDLSKPQENDGTNE